MPEEREIFELDDELDKIIVLIKFLKPRLDEEKPKEKYTIYFLNEIRKNIYYLKQHLNDLLE